MYNTFETKTSKNSYLGKVAKKRVQTIRPFTGWTLIKESRFNFPNKRKQE